eukprot:UC1_evm1s1178
MAVLAERGVYLPAGAMFPRAAAVGRISENGTERYLILKDYGVTAAGAQYAASSHYTDVCDVSCVVVGNDPKAWAEAGGVLGAGVGSSSSSSSDTSSGPSRFVAVTGGVVSAESARYCRSHGLPAPVTVNPTVRSELMELLESLYTAAAATPKSREARINDHEQFLRRLTWFGVGVALI